jgi:carbonic anhydrase/acetyltransferase-like protein (isoleucine patch superfamily)
MLRPNPQGDRPEVHASAFVDPTAILCGKVIVRENVFIGPYAVIRADEVDAEGQMQPIDIGAHSNIQDGVVSPCRLPPPSTSPPKTARSSTTWPISTPW